MTTDPGPRRPGRSDRLLWAAVALGLLVWIIFMFRNLGSLSLWMDEGFHYLAAQGILEHGYPLYPSGHIYYKAILYAYALAGAALAFGLTAETLRAVSVLCAAGLLGLVVLVGKRFFSRTVGVLAAVILALSIWPVEYARLALYFAPLALFTLLGLYFFYRGFFEEDRRFKTWATVVFVLTPFVHQLGMAVAFAFPALFLIRGAKRFFRKDVLTSLAVTGLFYLGMQVHEYFFWKVGYVYEKTDMSLGGMVAYFFGSFSLDYFKEFFRSFPWMSLTVLAGMFLCLGAFLRKRDGGEAAGGSGDGSLVPWLYLNLSLVFPLLFLAFFRTHVQPRYITHLFPVFVLLFLAALRSLGRVLVEDLAAPALGIRRPGTVRTLAAVVFLGLVLALVEGAGPGKVLSIVERRYGDPVAADIITRSGRLEQEDNETTGLFVRQQLRDDDIVIAIHVVFEKIYVGRVDYWLWSGGPGTWDAWEKTADGWKDFYVGARWINDLAGLRKVVEENPGRRVWLVGSTSLARRDHINREIFDYIAVRSADKLAFRGRDGVSAVYVWNAPEITTGGRRAAEGEWFPARWGRVAYGEGMSGGAAVAWPGTQRRADELKVRVPGTYPAGAHRLVLRSKAGAGGGELRAFSAAVEDERGTRLRTVTVPAEAAATGEWRETSAWFVLPAEGRIRLRFIVPARSAVTIDWADIRPGGERP